MSKTVLIVDDVELSREVIKNAVMSLEQKINVQFAENAFDAMNKIYGVSFDLIIMDIMMPNGDGFELLGMMSHHGVTSKIMITSGLDKSIVSSVSMLGKLYELDVIASLVKPIWSDQISQLVTEALFNIETHSHTKNKCFAEIDDDDFPISLVYQPQVVSTSSIIYGFEVLSRWSDENGALLPPSHFLPVIEELGKKKVFTNIMIKKFIQDYRLYFKDLNKSIRFSINIPPDLLTDENVVEQLIDIYNHGVKHTVVVEITEQGLEENIEKELLANVLKLRLSGFEISIDDFGIEASNIERVIKLPINEIKIDKKITWGLHKHIDYMQKLDELKKLVSVKNARIVYEGVENRDTSEFLEGIGGFNQQGFYHGVPSSPHIIVKMINDKNYFLQNSL
ncbi:EAL domain-containing protein [Vibrio apostichopi]|uniref:EAL domain-containing protein n=1 Tax=Vibrio apostichopi TaxID=3035453 RepID=UPI002573369C|nr:EAL domain-containing protein [Vibrio sp. FE10]